MSLTLRLCPLLLLTVASLTVSGGKLAGLEEPAYRQAAHPACVGSGRSVRGSGGIHEAGFASIGGIEQWITIDGEDCANAAVLFLHGGPGNPLTPYAQSIYGSWTSELTLVQWDQRAAGKTYGRNPPDADSTLTIEQMTRDGILVAEYAAKRLGGKKLVLTGGSWGSVLGVHMVKTRPDLFIAWVGVNQLVSKVENQAASYARVLALARDAGDAKTVSALEAIGAPPWKNPRNFGLLRRATRVFEGKTATAAPASWWVRAQAYDTKEALADYESGEDFSFMQFVGLSDDGMFSSVNLPALGFEFSIPVYLVQGAEDLVTVKEVTARYFEQIKAPRKKLVIVPAAGHDPNEALVRAHLEALRHYGIARLPR
jgi:pimeloyl-ACP methyl ester carboxylesterase